MVEWKEYKVQDVCDKVVSGGTPLTSNKDYYYPATVPWLKTGEVNYSYIYKTENFISEKGLEKSSAKLIPVNSVIVAMYGQGDTAGRVAVNKIPLSTNQACCNLQINEKIAHYAFVYYYLWTQYQQLVLYKTGGAQPNLNVDKIKKLKILLPPLPTQQKIASILSAYDNLIQNYKKQIDALQTAASELYKEWFVRFRFPGYQSTKFENGIPERWKVEKVGDYCKVFTGKKDVNQTVEDGKYAFFSCSPDTFKSNEYIFDGKAILVAGNGSYTGRTRFFEGKFDLYQRTYAITTKKQDLIEYLYWVFKNDFESRYSGGTRGAAIPYIVLGDITKYKFLYSEEFVRKFVSYVIPINKKLDLLQQQITNLTQQRDLLLPRLMSGKLEVEE